MHYRELCLHRALESVRLHALLRETVEEVSNRPVLFMRMGRDVLLFEPIEGIHRASTPNTMRTACSTSQGWLIL